MGIFHNRSYSIFHIIQKEGKVSKRMDTTLLVLLLWMGRMEDATFPFGNDSHFLKVKTEPVFAFLTQKKTIFSRDLFYCRFRFGQDLQKQFLPEFL